MDKFETYKNMLIETNKNINLTTITDPDEIDLKHFKDSLTILDYINEGDKVLDIGSGPGFPGLPLRIEKDFDFCKKKGKFHETSYRRLGPKKYQGYPHQGGRFCQGPQGVL